MKCDPVTGWLAGSPAVYSISQVNTPSLQFVPLSGHEERIVPLQSAVTSMMNSLFGDDRLMYGWNEVLLLPPKVTVKNASVTELGIIELENGLAAWPGWRALG